MDPDLEKTLQGSYCVCYNISYNEISIFVRNNKEIKTLEDVMRYFACCGKCQLCCPDVQKIVDFYNKKP